MESLPDLVTWNTSDIPYRYCRSRRRTLCITVYPDLSVLVRVPMRAKPEAIREFVLKHALWIIKTWRRTRVALGLDTTSASIHDRRDACVSGSNVSAGGALRTKGLGGVSLRLHPRHSEGRTDRRDCKKAPLSLVPY